jgi:glutamyl-Q tRNA(Asp) synthetase
VLGSTDTLRPISSPKPYVGRFAPSPTGPLHFGSLVCALASFLHAKQNNGKWLVRIEDVDPPRVDTAMTASIITSLSSHGLLWDNEISYQSQHSVTYEAYLAKLAANKLLYGCACSRQQIKSRGNAYDGHCRNLDLPLNQRAIRFRHNANHSKFNDLFLGEQHIKDYIAREDPVVKRADGIYAYHLAVVVDDIEQNVSHIVRGNDLLETTPVHLSLYEALNAPPPVYIHIPVVAQHPNEKLSKQHRSPAIDDSKPIDNVRLALQYLGVKQEKLPICPNITELLDWAIANWSLKLLPKQSELLISVTNDVYSATENMLTSR